MEPDRVRENTGGSLPSHKPDDSILDKRGTSGRSLRKSTSLQEMTVGTIADVESSIVAQSSPTTVEYDGATLKEAVVNLISKVKPCYPMFTPK